MRRLRFAASLAALAARTENPSIRHDDGHLWAIALGASLFGNVVIFLLAGFATLESDTFRNRRQVTETQPPPQPSVTISPDMFQKIPEQAAPAAAPAPAPPQAPEFARTSEDQRGKRPDKPAFLGERDTEATSDRTPDPAAKPLPSQQGVEPRDEGDIETTESRYRDGPLNEPGKSASSPAMEAAPLVPPALVAPSTEAAAMQPAPPAVEPSTKAVGEKAMPEVPQPADLLQGPNAVDVPVPKPMPEQTPPPTPAAPSSDHAAKAPPQQKPPAPAKPVPKPGDPGFRGNQRKTAIRGSISRSGRSALDVADSPLGRYQAQISRAVEQEWQRNCVRHRDFITPGFLTVRFFVEPSGKVKSVQFVGEMETGEVQKGFTLNSIRDADIPAMPKELRAGFTDESLELIFNFYF